MSAERRILESLIAAFEEERPTAISLRILLNSTGIAPDALRGVLDGLQERGLVLKKQRGSLTGYLVTRRGIRYYVDQHLGVRMDEPVRPFKAETLEAIARYIAEDMSGSEIRRFLASTCIPDATIGRGTKWREVNELLVGWNSGLKTAFIVKLVLCFLDPARYVGCSEHRDSLIEGLNLHLEHDSLRIRPDGSVVHLSKVEAPPKAYIDAFCDDETQYTLEVIVPLLKRLGFRDVVYTHGRDEYGRDVTFSEVDAFGILRSYAVQVKTQVISGEAGSLLDKIVAQIQDAFLMPFTDLATKQERHIAAMYVITSKSFTKNAVSKILGKISHPAIRNNVFFLHGEKVKELWRTAPL